MVKYTTIRLSNFINLFHLEEDDDDDEKSEASYEAKLLRQLYDQKMDSVDAVPETTRQAVVPKPSRNMFMFTTREAAEERARQIGCSGFHTHKIEDMTYYMPCASHEAFERSKKSLGEGLNLRELYLEVSDWGLSRANFLRSALKVRLRVRGGRG